MTDFCFFGGAEGEISCTSLPHGASPLWRPMIPACDPRSLGEPLSQTISFDPPQHVIMKIKKAGKNADLCYFMVELRGIEPLTPRLPALCSPS